MPLSALELAPCVLMLVEWALACPEGDTLCYRGLCHAVPAGRAVQSWWGLPPRSQGLGRREGRGALGRVRDLTLVLHPLHLPFSIPVLCELSPVFVGVVWQRGCMKTAPFRNTAGFCSQKCSPGCQCWVPPAFSLRDPSLSALPQSPYRWKAKPEDDCIDPPLLCSVPLFPSRSFQR